MQANATAAASVGLLVSLAVAEQMKSPLLMANLASVRRKLMASFAPPMKRRINKLKSRILIGESASPFVLSAFSAPIAGVVEQLHQAFLMMCAININYRAESGNKTKRTIEPHYLLLSYPVWYVLAWDHLRNEVRTFRCDRIEKSKILDEAFRLRPFSVFEKAMAGVDAIRP